MTPRCMSVIVTVAAAKTPPDLILNRSEDAAGSCLCRQGQRRPQERAPAAIANPRNNFKRAEVRLQCLTATKWNVIQASSTNGNWLPPTEWCGDCTTDG